MSMVIGISPPRSGTAWLSNFLTWGNSFIHHEAMFGVSDLEEYLEVVQSTGAGIYGSMDTSACFIAPALYNRFPEAKYIILVRPREDVENSYTNFGIEPSVVGVYEGIGWAYENIPPDQFLLVEYDNMFNHITLKKIWEFIGHPDPYPFKRAEMLRGMYVEDGFRTGFGRFVDEDVVQENLRHFRSLCHSVGGMRTIDLRPQIEIGAVH